ncbi:MAG: alpha/beta hydrolase [Gammaproteobacteria bacterium]|nr:alpha/beta hydrolase [Gammaproteobacteria bacterium]
MKKVAIFLTLFVACLVGLMAAFPEDATRVAFAVERFRSGLEHKSIVMDGETWHYLDGGPADAPVVLLLHGFAADKDNWTRFSRKLTGQYRIIAPDLPGFGESARQRERDYSVPAQSDWLHDFAATLKLDRFHLGGNSMGGYTAAFYAYRYSSQIESLLLIDNAGITSPNTSEMELAVGRGENPLLTSSAEDFDRLLSFVAYKQPFVPWPAKGVLAQRSFEDSAFNRRIFEGYKDARDVGLEPILADINQPVLIIWGEFDRVLDISSIDVMRPLLPQAKVVIMQDTGHIPMLERPQETAAHYLEFLGSL